MSSFESSHAIWLPPENIHEKLLRDAAPLCVLVSAPMGGNKSKTNNTIIDFLDPYDRLAYGKYRHFSVSKTSRVARPGEVDGVHYDFEIPHSYFIDAYEKGLLLETDFHAGEFYGTPTPVGKDPVLIEIETRGFRTALRNKHPQAEIFRQNVIAIYIVQQKMAQLISQILERPDTTISEEKKLARACRYAGELQFILDHALPYTCIENIEGDVMSAPISAVRVVAGDSEAPILSEEIIKAVSYTHLTLPTNREV